jgi:DNA end-binding protein Ku
MARSIWNGTIAFGLVNVPVKVFSATDSKTVHFREVHAKDGAAVEHRRFCSKEDREVPYEEVVRGHEVRDGEFVVLAKEEVAAADAPRGKVVDVDEFVDASAIDPVFYDKTYNLGAREGGEEAYRVLLAALEKADRVGIGRWQFHSREQLVGVRARDGLLAMHTMRFADELVTAEDLDRPGAKHKPSDREADMAAKLVESLHAAFDPEAFEDSYREAVLEVIRRKAAGEEIEAPEAAEESDEEPDLAAMLEASLGGADKPKKKSAPKSRSKSRSSSSRGKGSSRSKSAGSSRRKR